MKLLPDKLLWFSFVVGAVVDSGLAISWFMIAAADEHNLAMIFTGIRHFRH